MIRKLSWCALAAVLAAPDAPAQNGQVARQVFSSDSIDVMIGSPTISPDERWLVFTRSISNQETRLLIRPLAGGEIRELVQSRGYYGNPRFTPQGDRLVLSSDLPRRGPADANYYLVSAPFDTRTGTLTAPLRQVALDPVNSSPQHATGISPDGRWVAYMEASSRALKIVPLAGGNAQTLTDQERGFVFPTWTPDGRAVLYATRQGDEWLMKRVGLDGKPPVVVLRSPQMLGAFTPDNRHYVVLENLGPTKPRILHVFAADGRLLGDVELPARVWGRSGYAANGKYIMGTRSNSVAPIKLVPVAGGPIQQLTKGDVYDWAGSWTPGADALHVWTEEGGRAALALVGRDGRSRGRFVLPDLGAMRTLGEQDGLLVYLEGSRNVPDGARLMLLNLKDGSRRELAKNVRTENGIEGPGGMYYGLYGGEAYYEQSGKNGAIQVRAMNLRGESRLIGEVPNDRAERSGIAVFQSRIVYSQTYKDSVRLQLTLGPNRPATTLGTFPRTSAPGEIAWSHDGNQLTFYLGDAEQRQLVYRFDAAGQVQGQPLSFRPPFEYWYEVFWLPDGSGLTMIAQPKGKPATEVALVKFSDPEHPVYLTSADPASKWGHSLSPDGRYVAYASDQPRGSSIYLIEFAELLRRVKAAP